MTAEAAEDEGEEEFEYEEEEEEGPIDIEYVEVNQLF